MHRFCTSGMRQTDRQKDGQRDGQIAALLNAVCHTVRVQQVWYCRMAPEVVACETLKDTPYDTKADIWSLGLSDVLLLYNIERS